jgi:alpha-aminoadipate carrier protein LysW
MPEAITPKRYLHALLDDSLMLLARPAAQKQPSRHQNSSTTRLELPASFGTTCRNYRDAVRISFDALHILSLKVMRERQYSEGEGFMVACPECENDLDVDKDLVEEGEIVSCPECGSDFEVITAEPLELSKVEEGYEEDEEDEEEEEEDE